MTHRYKVSSMLIFLLPLLSIANGNGKAVTTTSVPIRLIGTEALCADVGLRAAQLRRQVVLSASL